MDRSCCPAPCSHQRPVRFDSTARSNSHYHTTTQPKPHTRPVTTTHTRPHNWNHICCHNYTHMTTPDTRIVRPQADQSTRITASPLRICASTQADPIFILFFLFYTC